MPVRVINRGMKQQGLPSWWPLSVSIPYTMAEVRKASSACLFTVASTFSGCGGSSTGYRLAGGKVLAVNEFMQAARDSYSANYPDVTILPADIRDITGKDLCEAAGVRKGELDILDGSPPCASFSTAGSREKAWGKSKKYSDTEQRCDDLFFEFARVLREAQPRCFVAENVKGLTIGIAKNVLGNRRRGFADDLGLPPTVYSELQQCGYVIAHAVLNAADYGVPQMRRRVIFIGVRKDLNIAPTHPLPTVSRYVSVREAIVGVVNKPTDFFPLPTKGTVALRLLCACKPGHSCDEYHPKGFFFQFSRLEGDIPSPTIVASGPQYHFMWNEDRYLSIAECKRICAFPDDFILTGNQRQRWERMGRAVPPLMMKAIAEHVYKTVLMKTRT